MYATQDLLAQLTRHRLAENELMRQHTASCTKSMLLGELVTQLLTHLTPDGRDKLRTLWKNESERSSQLFAQLQQSFDHHHELNVQVEALYNQHPSSSPSFPLLSDGDTLPAEPPTDPRAAARSHDA